MFRMHQTSFTRPPRFTPSFPLLALVAFASACSSDMATGAMYDGYIGVPGAGGAPITLTIPLKQGMLPVGGGTGVGGALAVGGAMPVGGATSSGSAGAATGGGTGDPDGFAALASAFCGDGVRDPVREECDDGPNVGNDTGDFCSPYCQITDARAVTDGTDQPRAAIGRRLGAGRHPTAATANGFALALVQHGPSRDSASVRVARYDAFGHRTGIIEASASTLIEEEDADPVVAMTPADDIVVAYTDFGGDGDAKGIAARIIRANQTSPEKAAYVGQNVFGSQYAPDILALSDRLILAWTDEGSAETGPDIRYRELGFDLTPLTEERTLVDSGNVQGRVALTVLGTGWGATWRASNGSGHETTEAYDATANVRWSVPAYLPAHPEEVPALLPLDATHHALMFTAALDTDGDAGDDVSDDIYVAALDTSAPGTVQPVRFPMTATYQPQAHLARRRPAIVRTQTDAFVTWWSSAPLTTTKGEDVWLERLTASITGTQLTLSLQGELTLPRWATETNADQRFPSLVVSPRIPANAGGSLFAAWDDYSGAYANESHPDVIAQLAPIPIVRQPNLISQCSATSRCGSGVGPCSPPDNQANAGCSTGLVCNGSVGPQFGFNVGVGVCVYPHCGNGVKDSSETGVDCGGADCGTCRCGDGIPSPLLGEVCDEGKQTASCELNCQVPACGDKIINASVSEQCDDGNAITTDACIACKSAYCGDNIIQSGVDECDDGINNSNTGECTLVCRKKRCGDGFVQAGEVCDDGTANGTKTSGCTVLCQRNVCGDGVQGLGEECDLGVANDNYGACTKACKNAACGDGFKQSGEDCDDGNRVDNDACPNSCHNAICGNGIKEGSEPCDDGNQSNMDACSYGCKAPYCGDKFIWAGHEDCEPLLDSSCKSDCTATKGCLTSGSCLSAWAQARDSVSDNAIKLDIHIKNNGGLAVPMSSLKLRYWLSSEGTSPLVLACDSAVLGCSKVVLASSSVAPVKRGAEKVVEITFASTAPTLAAGTESNSIQLRFTKQDTSVFNEADDFSYPGTAAMIADLNFAIYQNNTLVWGNEPHAVPYCGDGVTDTTEQCDTTVQTATCNANCTKPVCGDAILNTLAGEICDLGGNTPTCDSNCTAPACNDGVWNTYAGEVCDPSIVTGCKSDCKGWATAGTACTQSTLCLHTDHKYLVSLTDNQLSPVIHIVNSSNAPVSMRDVTLRYWFTGDTNYATYATSCTNANFSSSSGTNQCNLVTQSIATVSPVKSNADHVWTVTFNSDAQLAPGASTNDISLKANKGDWSMFSESNDWSQNSSTTFKSTTHIALYVKGLLMWGEEPK